MNICENCAKAKSRQKNVNRFSSRKAELAGERLFVTILFTQMEGELNAALPLTVTGKQRIRATFKNPRDAAVGWMLTDATTHTAFAQGINPLLDSKRMRNGLATRLDITVESDTSKKSVRGPMIAAK